MKPIRMSSIEQYRNAIREVQYRDPDAVLDYEGTVKLHGTNAGVLVTDDGCIYAQSKNNIITPEKDNHGFATWLQGSEGLMNAFISTAIDVGSYSSWMSESESIVFYGEWCGEGIQSGVGISSLPKMFVVFGIRLTYGTGAAVDLTGDIVVKAVESIRDRAPDYETFPVWAINEFGTYKIRIDFSDPRQVQNDLIEMTQAVEAECPVAKYFGVQGIGEGIVWAPVSEEYKSMRYWFKVKGDKHSATKVKKLAEVDIERMKSIDEFVSAVVTDNRCKQALDFLREEGKPIQVQATGDFIRWVSNDIFKEESDTLEGNGFTRKDIGRPISTKAGDWFRKYLESSLGQEAA